MFKRRDVLRLQSWFKVWHFLIFTNEFGKSCLWAWSWRNRLMETAMKDVIKSWKMSVALKTQVHVRRFADDVFLFKTKEKNTKIINLKQIKSCLHDMIKHLVSVHWVKLMLYYYFFVIISRSNTLNQQLLFTAVTVFHLFYDFSCNLWIFPAVSVYRNSFHPVQLWFTLRLILGRVGNFSLEKEPKWSQRAVSFINLWLITQSLISSNLKLCFINYNTQTVDSKYQLKSKEIV